MDPQPLRASLETFVNWRETFLKGDEKGEAQVFLDRLFQALGHGGVREAGGVMEERIRGGLDYGVSFADLVWKPRVIVEMKKAGTDLSRHYRQAFDYWMRAVPDRPRYVVLCNFDEFWVYDFDQVLDEPQERIALADLPARFEALAFLLPEEQAPIFGTDLVKVTRAAAAQVSGVFRSIHARGIDRVTAQHFVLQSVVAMFAEDIGLLPGHFFTRVVEESRTGTEAYDLLGLLFTEMKKPGRTPGGRFAGTPYFNGGLFERIESVELTEDELLALRAATITDWSDVRPEIFGTLFETSMDADERHAYGAHFTSPADIAKVVIPTIVNPWRERIDAAKTIPKLEQLLLEMSAFKVLDPACGSGNFLYVAYREMRRLEAEVKQRIVDRRRSEGLAAQAALSYVTPDHFLGMDTNPFAVEVAKVTMMMAKKLAVDELGDHAEDALPLDNLDATIVTRDALFTPWPDAHVIIGNPPYMGRRKMQLEMPAAYLARLDDAYPSPGVSDFVTYWFPIAHDALKDGGRAGFVATQAIRNGNSREKSLDYVVNHDGVIFDAVSSQPWSGDAAVTVSIVNWVKGSDEAPVEKTLWLDNGQRRLVVDRIPATLRPATDVTKAFALSHNQEPKLCFQGQTTGNVAAFRLTRDEARDLVLRDPASAKYIHPQLSARPLMHQLSIEHFVIDLPHSDSVLVNAEAPGAIQALRLAGVLAERQERANVEAARNAERLAANPRARVNRHHENFLRTWWQHAYRREDMLEQLSQIDRYIALSRVAAEGRMSIYTFVDPAIYPDDSLTVIALDDDYSFGIVQSKLHREWFDERCSKLEARPRYTSTTVWDSFPWPTSPPELVVRRIARIAGEIIALRCEHMERGITLGQQYDAIREPGQSPLRDLHDQLDAAVYEAYGFNPEEDTLAQLLALNLAAAEDPANARAPGGRAFGGVYTSTYRCTAVPL